MALKRIGTVEEVAQLEPTTRLKKVSEEPAQETAEPETEFKDKMLEYGKKLAYDLGMVPRWGVEGVARAIGTITDPFGEMMAKATGRTYQPLEEYAAEKLTQAGVPEETAAYEKPGEIMKSVTAAAVPMAAAGKLAAAPGVVGQAATELAAQPAAQLVGAGTGSLAQQEAAEAGAGPVGQFAANIVGGSLGAGLTQVAKARPGPAVTPAGLQEAESRGIRVLTEDVIQPESSGGKIVQSATGKILGGTGSQRAAQQVERTKAAQDFVRQYASATGDDMLGDVLTELEKKRGFKVNAYNKLKTDVINKLDNKGSVPVGQTVTKIDEHINKLKAFDEESPLISFYENFKNKIQNKSLVNIEELRKDLGDQLGAMGKDPTLAASKRRGETISKDIYKALNEDMGDFIKQTGEPKDFNKWKAGNKKLEGMMKELEVGSLKRTLNNGEASPETVKTMLFSSKPSEARLLYRNLNPKGKRNARAALVQEALWRTSKGRLEELSPDIFKNKLRDLQKQTNIFFTGEDRKAINGLYNALKITEGAGKATAAPATGMQNLPVLIMSILGGAGASGGAMAAGAPGAALGAVAVPMTVGTIAKAYNSRPVRNALMQLSRLKVNDPEAAKAAKRLITALQSQKEEPAQ